MTQKSYRGQADIQQMANERKQVVKTEYTNYNEYMDAQKYAHEVLQSQPAVTCELCGYPMDYNGHVLSERESKWSIHDVCRKKMEGMLDRETGIARERKAAERRAQSGPRRY
jgi:hypothetical protein